MLHGVTILEDTIGKGPEVQRHRFYRMSLSIWLNQREPLIWSKSPRFMAFGLSATSHLSEDGCVLTTDYRLDREFIFEGLCQGIQGMRIGGKRILRIAPFLAYRNQGVEKIIPPNTPLKVEIIIHGERKIP